MEKEKGTVFVDPCAVTPRRLNLGEMEYLTAGGALAVIAIATGVGIALIAY